ncbi:MAG: hypothetical protein ORN24_05145 [Burkholderiales bacterium]|nr:hypothetical protein [Burkholderiales bacterium]
MLTYSSHKKPQRKDLPWLLFIISLIWVLGTAFFHSPWEPYEPFVMAVVKGILNKHSWLVPYVSNVPYLQIQPFYFWLYSAILKLFKITNIYSIADSIRILNTMLIFAIVIVSAKIGSSLSAFKNGRTVVLILISLIGFINNAYQLSPLILVLLGFCLFVYALVLFVNLPGISGWILFIGLLFISINYTCEYILVAVLTLLLLPVIDRYWRNKSYLITVTIGITMFVIIFFLYCYALNSVNDEFFTQWQQHYGDIFFNGHYHFAERLKQLLEFLSWYLCPAWFLLIWSIYKRKKRLFEDKIIQVSTILGGLIFIFALINGHNIEDAIFPIVLPVVLLASIEIDSMRISIVALLNWFSIFIFGSLGLIIWLMYLCLMLQKPDYIVSYLYKYTQNYTFDFSLWHAFLALLITAIWLFMITRKHIRGRELVTNWASGTTYVIILFLALMLPWFDSILTFKHVVQQSLKSINPQACISTNTADSTQSALWYYYADVNLIPTFVNLNFSVCEQAIIATENKADIDLKQWYIMSQGQRPIDKKVYYVLRHK